jgi:carboxyl-terminal processing protease
MPRLLLFALVVSALAVLPLLAAEHKPVVEETDPSRLSEHLGSKDRATVQAACDALYLLGEHALPVLEEWREKQLDPSQRTEIRRTTRSLPEPDVLLTQGKTHDEIVKYLRGVKDSSVQLTVLRDGRKEPWEVTLKRGPVPVESVLGRGWKADDTWDWWLDAERRIGYVRITSFSRDTVRQLDAALGPLREGRMRALVLDLRFNPGGLLQPGVNVASRFVGDRLIVTIHTRTQVPEFKGEKPGGLGDVPVVCLVNGDSASGSEMVAAALQDHGRAVVVGERTGGKGSVQNIQMFDRRELKFTTGVFLRPNGQTWDRIRLPDSQPDHWGVRPDKGFAVPLPDLERFALAAHLERRTYLFPADMPPEKRLPPFRDRQLERALEHLRAKIKG